MLGHAKDAHFSTITVLAVHMVIYPLFGFRLWFKIMNLIRGNFKLTLIYKIFDQNSDLEFHDGFADH